MAVASVPPIQAALLVAAGAVPGAWLRFAVVNHLEPRLPRRHWGTVLVNLLACFLLGALLSLQGRGQVGSAAALLVGTGFLGSMSTFSSLAAELEACLARGERREPLLLVSASLLGGLLALLAAQALWR